MASCMCVFGETVYIKETVSKTGQGRQQLRVKGADTSWRKGIWVGRAEAINGHIVFTDGGTRLTRTVRRFSDEARYQKEIWNGAREFRGIRRR